MWVPQESSSEKKVRGCEMLTLIPAFVTHKCEDLEYRHGDEGGAGRCERWKTTRRCVSNLGPRCAVFPEAGADHADGVDGTKRERASRADGRGDPTNEGSGRAVALLGGPSSRRVVSAPGVPVPVCRVDGAAPSRRSRV